MRVISIPVLVIMTAGATLFSAAGLLWWRFGNVVFQDYAWAALAWCF
jgi:hypothetical protein